MSERRLRDDALAIWKDGVEDVSAWLLVHDALRDGGSESFYVSDLDGKCAVKVPTSDICRIAVVGAGKATTAMAHEAASRLWRAKRDGLSVVPGWVNVPDATVSKVDDIHVHGARTLPDNRPTAEGVEGSRRILEIARSLGEEDLLLVLLSGGGSALLPLPVDGVTLVDKLRVTALLQEHGATINEMNCVRKHLSQIKGGGLAQATKARVVTLIVSDVIGDPIDVIASGPTAPDPTTYADALAVLDRHGCLASTPSSVVAHLKAGVAGLVEETPKFLPERVTNVVIGNNATARCGAVWRAKQLGYDAIDLGIVEGDTQTAAARLVDAVRSSSSKRPTCLVSGGETTVDLAGATGKGGRNQEFALAILDALGPDGLAGVCVLCGGTDGEDGPTDAAGAIVDESLARDAQRRGLDPADFLARHDAYNFFEPLGGLVRTGPTGTNVMDLRVVLIDRGATSGVPALGEPMRKRASAEPGA